jgi:hypothetical protein
VAARFLEVSARGEVADRFNLVLAVTIKTTMSEDGQISIPKSVLEMLHLKPGAEVLVEQHSDCRTMRGMFRDGPDLVADLTAARAAEVEVW